MGSGVQAIKHALLWTREGSTNVAITHTAGSAFPVGAEEFLLGPLDAPSPAADLPVATLGRCVYAALEPHHQVEPGKLLTQVWREVARQALPFVHPSAKEPDRKQSRAALLLTGPERGGKAMEVVAAGRAIGMHVLEVDCRSLAGSMLDEAECVAHLELTMQQV